MEQLPAELIEEIAAGLDEEDLLRLRLTSRGVCKAFAHSFGATFLATVKTNFSTIDIRRLEWIAANFPTSVRAIVEVTSPTTITRGVLVKWVESGQNHLDINSPAGWRFSALICSFSFLQRIEVLVPTSYPQCHEAYGTLAILNSAFHTGQLPPPRHVSLTAYDDPLEIHRLNGPWRLRADIIPPHKKGCLQHKYPGLKELDFSNHMPAGVRSNALVDIVTDLVTAWPGLETFKIRYYAPDDGYTSAEAYMFQQLSGVPADDTTTHLRLSHDPDHTPVSHLVATLHNFQDTLKKLSVSEVALRSIGATLFHQLRSSLRSGLFQRLEYIHFEKCWDYDQSWSWVTFEFTQLYRSHDVQAACGGKFDFFLTWPAPYGFDEDDVRVKGVRFVSTHDEMVEACFPHRPPKGSSKTRDHSLDALTTRSIKVLGALESHSMVRPTLPGTRTATGGSGA